VIDVRCTLPRAPWSTRAAREVIRDVLAEDDELPGKDAAVLVVSELVANALRHANRRPTAIELHVTTGPGTIHIEVEEGDGHRSVSGWPAADGEQDRGLLLVERLAMRWGWSDRQGGGQQVWADVRTDEAWAEPRGEEA
jgi:anti-sigma regulatory factor (Ser/Thr protein kinase)